MTQTEFIKMYCKNSKITDEEFNKEGLFAIPCNCGDADCEGWAMTTHSSFFSDYKLDFKDKIND